MIRISSALVVLPPLIHGLPLRNREQFHQLLLGIGGIHGMTT